MIYCPQFTSIFVSAGSWQGFCEVPWTAYKGRCNQRLVWHQIPHSVDYFFCSTSVWKYPRGILNEKKRCAALCHHCKYMWICTSLPLCIPSQEDLIFEGNEHTCWQCYFNFMEYVHPKTCDDYFSGMAFSGNPDENEFAAVVMTCLDVIWSEIGLSSTDVGNCFKVDINTYSMCFTSTV